MCGAKDHDAKTCTRPKKPLDQNQPTPSFQTQPQTHQGVLGQGNQPSPTPTPSLKKAEESEEGNDTFTQEVAKISKDRDKAAAYLKGSR